MVRGQVVQQSFFLRRVSHRIIFGTIGQPHQRRRRSDGATDNGISRSRRLRGSAECEEIAGNVRHRFTMLDRLNAFIIIVAEIQP